MIDEEDVEFEDMKEKSWQAIRERKRQEAEIQKGGRELWHKCPAPLTSGVDNTTGKGNCIVLDPFNAKEKAKGSTEPTSPEPDTKPEGTTRPNRPEPKGGYMGPENARQRILKDMMEEPPPSG